MDYKLQNDDFVTGRTLTAYKKIQILFSCLVSLFNINLAENHIKLYVLAHIR